MNIQQIGQFMTAGDAVFALYNHDEGRKTIYRLRQHKDWDKGNRTWHVMVKVTKDGESDWGYVGGIKGANFYRNSAYSIVDEHDPIFQNFEMLFLKAIRRKPLPKYLEFTHMGRCGRCRRLLLDPMSVKLGIGPKCREYMNI
jgi:hypothetical protein